MGAIHIVTFTAKFNAMKIFYLLTPVLLISLIGCSSTYTVADFASRDKFYEDFNNSAGNKSLKIIMNNDSSINVGNGAYISNDSLIFLVPILNEERINKNDIEELIYNSYDINIINTVILKNGNSITANNIQLLSDSSIAVWDYINAAESLPLNDVKKISYKNHWLGVPFSILPGAIVGFLVGYGAYFINLGQILGVEIIFTFILVPHWV